jgi:hypothetical protein
VVDEVAGREPHMYFKVWFGPWYLAFALT